MYEKVHGLAPQLNAPFFLTTLKSIVDEFCNAGE